MKIVGLQCPSCGAELKIDKKNPNVAVCEYCESKYAIEWNREQAYFNRRIAAEIPTEQKKTGWEYYGWKRGLLLAGIGIALLALVQIPVYNKWKTNHGSAREMEVTLELPEGMGEEPSPLDLKEKETVLNGDLEALAVLVFGVPAKDISARELSEIKWLEMRYQGDNKEIGYSLDMPSEEGAELIWVTFPRDTDFGKECLCLFEGLKKINLSTTVKPKDIRGLKLESIGGYFDSPQEVAEIVEDVSLITEIRFNSGADSLDGLEQFTNLQSLCIDGSEMTDINQIVSLPDLKKLELEDFTNLSDFSVLSKISGLEELRIGSEKLKMLNFLQGMKNLKCLEITEGSMISLDGIEALSGLEKLMISYCSELKNMDAVTSLSGLKELYLDLPYDCPGPELGVLTQLEKLTLEQFTDCSFVKRLSHLKSLELYNCTVSDNMDLSALTELKELGIHTFAGSGQSVGFVKSVPFLERLDMQGISTYDDISPVFCMENLKELIISGMECEIDFDKIEDNHTLERLEMDGLILYNNVQVSGGGGIVYVDWDDVVLDEHTDFLGHLKGLKNLSIAENQLTDISFVTEMPVLETINLSENYVTQLRPLAELKSLKAVICTGNPVSNDRVLDDKILLIQD